MFARSAMLGTLLLFAPSHSGSFTLEATGAVALAIKGEDARYGLSRGEGGPMLVLTLGGNTAAGSLMLFFPGDRLPSVGRHPVRFSWDPSGTADTPFHACFVAGTMEQSIGWFHGMSGWVTVTEAGEGRIAGEFDFQVRGFLNANPKDENRWVTLRGAFEARADSTAEAVRSEM